MPTTSNFGWTTPADTDLVKDGALAIRTLGNGIDTSFLDLKGGTTGQNLRKASNTDLDFTFAGDATNTVIDAEGDLLVGDSADTLQRLAIGTTGQVLTVDTTLDGKVKWAAPASPATSYSLINAGGTALTGAATITISGISDKNSLFVTIIGCSSASGNSNFYIRLNADSGNNYGYFNAIMIAPDSVTEDSSAATNKMFIGAISANAGSVLSGDCWLDGCNTSGIKVMHHSTGSTNATGGNAQLNTGGGTWSGSATVSSISITSDTGNFDAGTIYVYGA